MHPQVTSCINELHKWEPVDSETFLCRRQDQLKISSNQNECISFTSLLQTFRKLCLLD